MEYKINDTVRVNDDLVVWKKYGDEVVGITCVPSMIEVCGEVAKIVEIDDDVVKLEFRNPKFSDYDFWFSTEMIHPEDDYDIVVKTLITRELLSRLKYAYELGILADRAICIMNTLDKLKSLIHDFSVLINVHDIGGIDYMSTEVIDMMFDLLHEIFEYEVFAETYDTFKDEWTNSGLLDN